MLSIGDKLPEFDLTAVVSANKENAFEKVNHNSYSGKWKVFVFWPKDFTFVCPTEIIGYGDLHGEFKDRDAQLLGASTDSDFVHLAWRTHDERLTNNPFPWLSDIKRELSDKLGILDKNAGVALRATLIVDPTNTIRHISVNDLKVGRNPQETLRVLDALQSDALCPCDWEKGEATL